MAGHLITAVTALPNITGNTWFTNWILCVQMVVVWGHCVYRYPPFHVVFLFLSTAFVDHIKKDHILASQQF